MLKVKNYLLLIIIVSLVGCEKDESSIPNNYLKADINGNKFVVYQDNRLNNDTVPNTFSFSFGLSTTNKTDTCLFISACLNRQNLHISFPKPNGYTTYTIYRKSIIIDKPSAFYSIVPKYAEETGLETFYTQNLLNVESYEVQPIGEIIIDKIDTKNRIIIGHFSFSAYGYKVTSTETFTPTNNVIGVTNGEFYYKWDESFNF